jgi:hypothetical protein
LPRNQAEIINYNPAGTPTWHATDETMAYRRARPDAVLLPDGKLFVVGGATYNVGDSKPWDPVLPCEMFDRTQGTYGTFETMASLSRPRMYHSSAILLPDGRVFATGNEPFICCGLSGEDPECCEDLFKGHEYEIYYPPYLWTSSGGLAARPTIEDGPDSLFYGQPFLVDVGTGQSSSISEVLLMKLGAVTHSNDMEQRRVVLEAVAIDADVIAATAPWQPEIAPPGDYMLMVLDDSGVPSIGRFVRMSQTRPTSTAQTGSNTIWAGTVRMDRDFQVEPGDTLTVLSGTTVLCKAGVDNENLGVQSGLTELIVRGSFRGFGSVGNEIEFGSYGGSGGPGE